MAGPDCDSGRLDIAPKSLAVVGAKPKVGGPMRRDTGNAELAAPSVSV